MPLELKTPLSKQPMRRVRTVHMVGIGGVGMTGIARVLINLGYTVTGSDIADSTNTESLRQLGAKIFIGHQASHVSQADVVVLSTAVSDDNPEVVTARDQRIPVVARAEMLAELMRFRYGIAIAGTHGKTTTTSLVATLLAEGELDPTFVVGGRVLGSGSNAKLGEGPYLVAEADESDASFLMLTPMLAVVTNIDADHLDTYEGQFSRLVDAFVEFLHHLPFYGLAVLCIDDPVIAEMLPRVGRQVVTYGLNKQADVQASNIEPLAQGTSFMLKAPGLEQAVPVRVNMPGLHNVRNALASIAVALELGIDIQTICQALNRFSGIGRRCQLHGEIDLAGKTCTLIDDYGHHPNEVAATIKAVQQAWPDRRVVVAFQPHRYTRTRDLFEDFCQTLADLDVLVLCDVYPAGEQLIANADGRALAQGIRARGRVEPVFVEMINELPEVLGHVVEAGDVVLTLGAGSIGLIAQQLAKRGQNG